MPCLPRPGHDSYWDIESLSNLLITQYFVSSAGQTKDSQSKFLHPGTYSNLRPTALGLRIRRLNFRRSHVFESAFLPVQC